MGLRKGEIALYLVSMIVCIIILMFTVYKEAHGVLKKKMILEGDLLPGWIFPQWTHRDVSDHEWMCWKEFFYESFSWYLGHFAASEIIHQFFPQAMPYFHVLWTTSFVAIRYPPVLLGYFITQALLFYIIIPFKSVLLVWVTGTMILLCYNSEAMMSMVLKGDNTESTVITISIGWFIIKCLGFSLGEIKSGSVSSFQKLPEALSYAFYFPTFHFGPYIPFEEFVESLRAPPQSWNEKRLTSVVWSFMKYGLYFLGFEVVCHVFYCHALMFHFKFSPADTPLALNSIGYCVAQLFYLKYVVIYGTMGSIARAEGFWAPPHPRCIHHIHFYSDMWRYFDRGFYLFILRCIYSPLCGRSISKVRKLFASFMCFTFVYLWHGASKATLYWALLNFLGISLEAFLRHMNKSNTISYFKYKYLSEENQIRLSSLIASPMWILAIISNSFFFCGAEIGILYFQQFLQGSLKLSVIYVTMSFCLAQVSYEINIRAERKDRLEKDSLVRLPTSSV